jgi:phage terminase large subunit GpA-like protein
MFVQPTDDMVKKHSKKKLAPTVRAIPCLKGIIKPTKSRDAGNTLLLKEFPGGSWTLTGSNSPVSARSDSIRYLILDDYDGFIQDAGGEGAPGELFKKRTDAFGGKKKIYINSTPTTKGTSHIEREWEESSQGHFNVPCPHCNEYQFLEFGGPDAEYGIKFDRDDDGQVTDAWYICQHCKKRIEEWKKTDMLLKGKYIHKYPNRKKRGFKINSQYSPLGWLSWAQISTEFIKAAKSLKLGDSRLMKVWVNTRQAETWEEAGEQPEWNKLASRAEPYKILTVPYGGMLLSAGVDTQDNRLEVLIEAYGRGEESWIIYQSALYGDPDLPGVWSQLDELLFRTYTHESGAEMHIESMGIDTGGHKTQPVYNYCRTRSPVVFALQGASVAGKPVIGSPTKQDVDFRGNKIKKGVTLWTIGTDVAKGTIYNRLKLVEPGFGYVHFPIGLSDEFYRQLTAEKIVKSYNKQGFPVLKWIKTRERNDVLDCKVYSYAAALKAGLARRDWGKAEQAFQSVRNNQPVPKQLSGRRVRSRGLHG